MNKVILIGRLTKKPELNYTQSGVAVTKITVAVDRVKKGGEQTADFPSVTVFDKTAENVCKYMDKGRQIAVEGRIQTGSYKNKDGKTVYTTDVVADKVEFIGEKAEKPQVNNVVDDYGFVATDDDIPF